MTDNEITIGNVQVLAITDIEVDFPAPLSRVFPDTAEQDWAPFRQRYPHIFVGSGGWRVHFGGYLLRSQWRTILVDTDIGTHQTNPDTVAAYSGGADGRLLDSMEQAGVSPEEVDTVFLTHLHPDHTGWNLVRDDGRPRATFPSARYVFHQADWDTFKKPSLQRAFPLKFWEETLSPLESLGVSEILTGETALTDEITAIPAPGHSPGHMCVAIASGGERALILGDVAINVAQITEPGWTFAFDMNHEMAARTREQILDRAEAENATLMACHFPSPGFGSLVWCKGRRYWQSL